MEEHRFNSGPLLLIPPQRFHKDFHLKDEKNHEIPLGPMENGLYLKL